MSTSSHRRELSQPNSSRRPPPPAAIIVTSPPWAKDEPPSPEEREGSVNEALHAASSSRVSDVHSHISSHPESASRWWIFNDPRSRAIRQIDGLPSSPKSEGKVLRSLSWIPQSSSFKGKSRDKGRVDSPPSAQPDTLSHTITPWNTPWTPKLEAQGPSHTAGGNDYFQGENHASPEESHSLKKFFSFILSNVYVPLLFRFVNIAFTTTVLALSIRIRNLESKNGILGAVGSSPVVVIIFSPPTLVHVFVAIYLEYFGRPLGLWRTSAKLAHTLVEVLFICLWSAALSLSFDNFFTSSIPCASSSAVAWYNQLPRPQRAIPSSEEAVGDQICNYQLSLICLVGFGLVVYCSNLILSLYRIFEKIKYHSPSRSSFRL